MERQAGRGISSKPARLFRRPKTDENASGTRRRERIVIEIWSSLGHGEQGTRRDPTIDCWALGAYVAEGCLLGGAGEGGLGARADSEAVHVEDHV